MIYLLKYKNETIEEYGLDQKASLETYKQRYEEFGYTCDSFSFYRRKTIPATRYCEYQTLPDNYESNKHILLAEREKHSVDLIL